MFSANLLLQDTIERIHVGKEYGDIPRGLFIVRGENVVLMGEVVSVREVGVKHAVQQFMILLISKTVENGNGNANENVKLLCPFGHMGRVHNN